MHIIEKLISQTFKNVLEFQLSNLNSYFILLDNKKVVNLYYMGLPLR